MPYSVKDFFEINEDMVHILLVLEVLFTQDSEVEDLFCGASSGSEPSLFFTIISSAWGLSLIKITLGKIRSRLNDIFGDSISFLFS